MKNYFYSISFGLVSLFNVTLVAQENKPDEKKEARVVRFVPGNPDSQHNPPRNSSQTGNNFPSLPNGKIDFDPAVVNQKTIDATFVKLVELFRVDFKIRNPKVKKEFSKDEQLKMVHNFECYKILAKELFIFLREVKQGRLSQVCRAFENCRDNSDVEILKKYIDLNLTESSSWKTRIIEFPVSELKAIQVFCDCWRSDRVTLNKAINLNLSEDVADIFAVSVLLGYTIAAYLDNNDLVETFFHGLPSLSRYIEIAYQPSCGKLAVFFDEYIPIWEKAVLQILDDAIAVFSAK